MFNNDETEVHIPLHRALRVRRGDRYQYYKQHDGLHPGDLVVPAEFKPTTFEVGSLSD
jgi:hypothetical protein